MKRTLTALTVAATMFASGVSAFEANITKEEANRLQGKPMVGDLSVGVKGLLYDLLMGCVRDGERYLYSTELLETDPRDYSSYYEIIRQADGEFTLTFGPNGDGEKRIPRSIYRDRSCENIAEDEPTVTFYRIKSINGFTDTRSFLIDLINQGYK